MSKCGPQFHQEGKRFGMLVIVCYTHEVSFFMDDASSSNNKVAHKMLHHFGAEGRREFMGEEVPEANDYPCSADVFVTRSFQNSDYSHSRVCPAEAAD